MRLRRLHKLRHQSTQWALSWEPLEPKASGSRGKLFGVVAKSETRASHQEKGNQADPDTAEGQPGPSRGIAGASDDPGSLLESQQPMRRTRNVEARRSWVPFPSDPPPVLVPRGTPRIPTFADAAGGAPPPRSCLKLWLHNEARPARGGI